MKFVFNLSVLLLLAVGLKSQELSGENNLTGFFSAIIVNDIESAINWYEQILDFKLLDTSKIDEIGLKQANMKCDDVHLELIQLHAAIDPSKHVENYSKKTKFVGFFKVGFRMRDFDGLMMNIEKNKIRVQGQVVTDPKSDKRMIILLDPDGNRIQIFEN